MSDKKDPAVRSNVLMMRGLRDNRGEIQFAELGPELTAVTRVSEVSKNLHTRNIPASIGRLRSWYTASPPQLVQRAFPELSADDREFLMTGITPEEWEETFGKPEDE